MHDDRQNKNKAVPIEIEHKFLIARPDPSVLLAQPGVRVLEIEQVYLRSVPGVTRRVRRTGEGGEVHYYRTEKRRISTMSAYEDETEITLSEYSAAVRESDPRRRIIRKTRYKIPYGGYILEIDIYPFWKDRAILEIEVPSEETKPPLPPYVAVRKDVSEDRRYKNDSLAKAIPSGERHPMSRGGKYKNQKHGRYKHGTQR